MALDRPKSDRHTWWRTGILLVLVTSALGCGQHRHPNRYLLPEGYTGGVTIVYHVHSAPPLPTEDGRYLLTIPPSGLLKTSTGIEYGIARDEYYYYSGTRRRALKLMEDGGGGLIWGGTIGGSQGSDEVVESFCVGPEQPVRGLTPVRHASRLDLFERCFPYAFTYLLGFSVLGFCQACYRERISLGDAIGRIIGRRRQNVVLFFRS